MSDKKLDVDALVEEPQDDTQYAPTETHALTPEEAARKVLDTPASAAPSELPKAKPMNETLPPGVTAREFGNGTVTEYVDQSAELPVAVNADADYEARTKATSTDFEAVVADDEGETVEK